MRAWRISFETVLWCLLISGFVLLCHVAQAGTRRQHNAWFPAGGCSPDAVRLADDETLLIEYRAGERSWFVPPGSCATLSVPASEVAARCVVMRREVLAPDEPVRASAWVPAQAAAARSDLGPCR